MNNQERQQIIAMGHQGNKAMKLAKKEETPRLIKVLLFVSTPIAIGFFLMDIITMFGG